MDNKIEKTNKIEKAYKPFVSEDDKDIIDSWYKRASEVTPETFGDFINELLHGYNLDYGAKIHATAACTIAMFNACSDIFSFSGFQGSASAIQILYKLNYPCNKTEYESSIMTICCIHSIKINSGVYEGIRGNT